MNAELEALVLALDAILQARAGDDAKRLEAIYQSRLDDVLARCSGLSREGLIHAVDFAYRKWLNTQKKPSSLPPKA